MDLTKKFAAAILALLCLSGCGSSYAENSADITSASTETSSESTKVPQTYPDLADIGFSVSGEAVKSTGEKPPASEFAPKVLFKAEKGQSDPLLTNIFCADPTAVEYNGRIYVFGTNDNQQYLEKGDSDNTYERIKSFVIMSSDDMANWRYEGEINTAEIAPWIYASWAPSVISREEADGLTHFYLYFSNSGAGVGVLTATDPAGPWTDPLGKPLISAGMEGLTDCPNPFDPGVCIDDNGVGWLAFGGGTAPEGTSYMPGTARICRLGEDMISVDSEFAEIPAPYFFEASELNFINGTYVYTYNTSWENRLEWDRKSGIDVPAACSMCYMTSKTPLDTKSWEYRDYYLKNPGELGLEYSNNHSHLEKFGDKYYLFFHTLILQKELGITKGFRSIFASETTVDEENVVFARCTANGTSQIKNFDPYIVQQAETAYLTDCRYLCEDGSIYAECDGENVICVKNVDLGEGSSIFAASVKGKGSIEIRTDSFESPASAVISFDRQEQTAVYENVNISGVHDLFFVLSGNFTFDEWKFC